MSATIHDQGYARFEGIRRPPSANLWVLARQGRRRALAPVSVKLTLGLGALLAVLVYPLVFLIVRIGRGAVQVLPDPVSFVRGVFDLQVWFFGFVVTLASGSGALAQDTRTRAFQYYFSKPVTPTQYAFGRIWPLVEILFALTFLPATLLILLGAGLWPDAEERLGLFGLLFPSLVYSVLIAVTLACASVACSALARSRALTMSTWAALFFLPHGVALIVAEVAGSEWMKLTSIPACLGIVGDVLFRRAAESSLHFGWALGVLAVVVWGSVVLVRRRLAAVETVG